MADCAVVGDWNHKNKMKPKPHQRFRDYSKTGGHYTKQGICPVCRQVRYVRDGVMLDHWHNGGRVVLGGQGVLCPGAGQKALGVEPLYLYYELSKL